MIWLLGDEDEAKAVAKAAGLKDDEWERLHWHRQLDGHHGPEVVALESALVWPRDKFGQIVTALVAAKARRWSEIELYTGKVPR